MEQSFSERDVTLEIFHPAVRRDDDAFGRHERQGSANTRGHDIRRLNLGIGQVNHTEQDLLPRQRRQDGTIES